VTLAKSLMAGKWKFSILWMLSAKTCRFNELERRLQGITQKTLTLQLRAMEKDLLIRREAFAVVPPRVEYSLTEQGKRLLPVMTALCEWTVQYWEFRKRSALVRSLA
jgi:DNA-binding HxlR family transcriptional regulator